MSNDFPRKRKFTALIDLTTRGQEVAKSEATQRELAAASASATTNSAEEEAPAASFTLADAPEIIRKAAVSAGWDRLMPVQEQTIPVMIAGRDLIVQSKTGSGKTGAFLLPFFAALDSSEAAPQALVLTPTRELARQIYDEFVRLGGPALGFRGALVYGGVAYGPQQDALRGTSKEGPAHVVIGTPGRILDHLERRTFSLDRLKTLVLDEADEMLSMGFLPAMRKLHRYLPAQRQSTMFSATMPPSVRSLAGQFLNAPQFLALSGGSVSVDALSHRYYPVDPMERDRALIRIIEMENPESAIIFANTKREVEYLAQFLRNYGHDAGEISGDLNQSARESMMARIRAGNLRFLVATDVAARGIDISDLSHVVQYDVPMDPEYYVHRAGRTARAGKTGVAITFVSPADKPKLLSIFRRYELAFEEREVPTEEEVAERVRERLTVLLEDRYRDLKPLARERIARFEPLARALADEEPHLLAMLLDGLYHESLHRAPQAEVIETSTHRGLTQLPREEKGRGRERDRGKGRRRDADDLYAPTPQEAAPEDAIDAAALTPVAARESVPVAPTPTAPEAVAAIEMEAPSTAAQPSDAPPAETAAEAEERDRRRGGRNRRRKRKSGAGPLLPESEQDAEEGEADGEADAPNAASARDDQSAAPAPPAGETRAATSDDEEREGRARRRRGGRNRRRDDERSEGDRSEAPAAAPSADEAPRRAEAAPQPDAPAFLAPVPEPAPALPRRAAAVPPGPYRIHELRTLGESTLRAIGEAMEVGEHATMGRDDLVYRILEVQAERESTGRGRRASTRPKGKDAGRGKPAPSAKPAQASRPAAPAPKSAPPAPTESTTDDAAPEAKRSRRSRGRGRRGTDAPRPALAVDAMLTKSPAVAAQPSEVTPPVEAAPQPRRSRGRKADAPAPAEAPAPSSAEAPAATEAPAETPRRTRAKKAGADEAALVAPRTSEGTSAEAPAETPKRTRAKKATAVEAPAPEAATPSQAAVETPKRARAKKAAEAPAQTPEPEAAEAPKPRARRKKAEAEAPTPEAPAETPVEKPKRTRAKKADAPASDEA